MSETVLTHREEFTMSNAIKAKTRHRLKMTALTIDEKIRIVEDLRERMKPIRELKTLGWRDPSVDPDLSGSAME